MVNEGNEREAKDEKKKPRADLVERNQVPVVELAGVEPNTREGPDILRDPHEQRG